MSPLSLPRPLAELGAIESSSKLVCEQNCCISLVCFSTMRYVCILWEGNLSMIGTTLFRHCHFVIC